MVVNESWLARSEQIVEDSDDVKLKEFLESINMQSIFVHLKSAQVTFRNLPFLKKEDLIEAVPPLGLRAEFREKLFAWKKTEFGIYDDTISMPKKVEEWLKRNEITTTKPLSNCSKNVRVLSKDLKTLLSETPKGKSMLEYSSLNNKLKCEHREEIINVIMEDIFCNDAVLCIQDFNRLLDAICSVFPHENDMKDYYYISRKGKNNASGKLYTRYRNKHQKRRRPLDSLPTSSTAASTTASAVLLPPEKELVEIDESVAIALKTSLIKECDNWEAVCEKWKQTYHIRQKDLQTLKDYEFLQEWPKLSDSRASHLINIDFDIMYPLKGHLLLSKWDKFKETVRNFYAKNLHNKYCKQLFTDVLSASNIDAQDYIYTISLNAVLPSPARFKSEDGKRRKKVTILDSLESFVLRLVTINDYKCQIDALVEKYYSAGLTIQPFIIVEGLTDTDIKDLENQLKELHSEVKTQIEGIAGMLAEIKASLAQLIKTKETFDGMEQIFPLETVCAMSDFENKIDDHDDQDLVNAVKKVVHRGGFIKNFRNLVGPEIIKNYNYDGVQNKESFKKFHKIDNLFFKAVESQEINFETYKNMIRKAFKLGKNKLYKDKYLKEGNK